MSFLKIVVLAIVQGLAELLPVSSSAHVVVAEKLMGLDPSAPSMTLLLVMLHTGTMFAVIVYFWHRWRATYFSSMAQFKRTAVQVIVATALTGLIGGGLKLLIEKTAFRGAPHAQIEDLFSHLELIAPALAAAGVLILVAGLREGRLARARPAPQELTAGQASLIGAVQGLCLPFRGFSRSGATISVGHAGRGRQGERRELQFRTCRSTHDRPWWRARRCGSCTRNMKAVRPRWPAWLFPAWSVRCWHSWPDWWP